VVFANNQVIYDFTVRRTPMTPTAAPISFFPVALLGLDHVSVASNQFGLRLTFDTSSPKPPDDQEGAQVFGHVLVLGATINVTRNRCASQVGRVFLSLVAFDQIMGITAANQATHDIVAISNRQLLVGGSQPDPFDMTRANQVLLGNKNGVDIIDVRVVMQEGFTKLLQFPSPGA
jgi:hypothetical protein